MKKFVDSASDRSIGSIKTGTCRFILSKTNGLNCIPHHLVDSIPQIHKKEKGCFFFPQPKEIGFTCSCPDWALMCKHVAAVLYGVGARLDQQPALFFELRSIEMERFIDVALANKVEAPPEIFPASSCSRFSTFRLQRLMIS